MQIERMERINFSGCSWLPSMRIDVICIEDIRRGPIYQHKLFTVIGRYRILLHCHYLTITLVMMAIKRGTVLLWWNMVYMQSRLVVTL